MLFWIGIVFRNTGRQLVVELIHLLPASGIKRESGFGRKKGKPVDDALRFMLQQRWRGIFWKIASVAPLHWLTSILYTATSFGSLQEDSRSDKMLGAFRPTNATRGRISGLTSTQDKYTYFDLDNLNKWFVLYGCDTHLRVIATPCKGLRYKYFHREYFLYGENYFLSVVVSDTYQYRGSHDEFSGASKLLGPRVASPKLGVELAERRTIF